MCAITCGRSITMLSVWGILSVFLWRVLVLSSSFFRRFFCGTICPSSFVFPGDSLVFFFSEELKAFCCRLTLLQIRVCWPVCPWLFQDFQSAYYASYALQLVGGLASGSFYVGSSIFLGFSGHFSSCFGPLTSLSNEMAVAVAHMLRQSVPTFVTAFHAENLTACYFPAWLFPISSIVFHCCFLRCFQLYLGCYHLAFLNCRYVELPHFVAAYFEALSGPLGGSSSCAPMSRWWHFYLLVLPDTKLVALCLLQTLNHVF